MADSTNTACTINKLNCHNNNYWNTCMDSYLQRQDLTKNRRRRRSSSMDSYLQRQDRTKNRRWRRSSSMSRYKKNLVSSQHIQVWLSLMPEKCVRIMYQSAIRKLISIYHVPDIKNSLLYVFQLTSINNSNQKNIQVYHNRKGASNHLGMKATKLIDGGWVGIRRWDQKNGAADYLAHNTRVSELWQAQHRKTEKSLPHAKVHKDPVCTSY